MDLLAGPRNQVTAALQRAFEVARFPQEQYTEPVGDPGLFGPGSVTWQVNADASLVIGGLSALMLQALHPLALAGVFDHSNFKDQPLRRLSRTASFVRATTYGSTPVAEAVIETVKQMHTRVIGVAPNGVAYRADDPDLLRWIHVAEVASFLAAHRRYHPHPIRGDALDGYYAETAVVAERLGATAVPNSRAAVNAYFEEVRPVLAVTERTRATMTFILAPVGRDPASQAASFVLGRGAMGLLPRWARELYGISYPPLFERGTIIPAANALLTTLRWAARPVILEQAYARATAPASSAA
jgi:uncharacterized protein (DUF2236 family)